jgi:hypothetical protein
MNDKAPLARPLRRVKKFSLERKPAARDEHDAVWQEDSARNNESPALERGLKPHDQPARSDDQTSDQVLPAAADMRASFLSLGRRFGQPPPTFHLARATTSSNLVVEYDNLPEDQRAKWHCCQCGHGNRITANVGNHIIGALACACPHKPCATCTVSGIVKPFLPMEEPAMVPVSEANGKVWFGSVCSACGLSWRAKVVVAPSLAQIHQARLAPAHRLGRKIRSTFNLRKHNLAPSTPAQQADKAAVRFGGFDCTCGRKVDLGGLCFQVTGKPTERGNGEDDAEPKPWFTTTPELQLKGHGTPTLKLAGGPRPNPLRSAPVSSEEAVEAKTLAILHGKYLIPSGHRRD